MGTPNRPWTMQEIAAAAGVSVTTVSHTLSGKRPVGAETAARIRSLIAESGYVPDAAGQRLKSGRNRVIGLAVPDISQSYFGRIARGAEEEADRAGYALIICSTRDSDPRREARYFDLLRMRVIDGLLYAAARDKAPSRELSQLADRSPLVLVDETMPALDVPQVTSDNAAGGELAAEHLIARGHTRAIVLSGPQALQSQNDRVSGFRRRFPSALVLHGDFEQESARRNISDAFDSGAEFTAVFACNDLMAIGALEAVRARGLRVPEDVSIVGFDDIDLASSTCPPLTTVRQDTHEMGRTAARRLIDLVESGIPAETVAGRSATLPVALVERASTAGRG